MAVRKPTKNEFFGPDAKLISRSGAEEARELGYDLTYRIINPEGWKETRIMCKVGKYYFDHTLIEFDSNGTRKIKDKVRDAIRSGKSVEYTYFNFVNKSTKGKRGRPPVRTVKNLKEQKKKFEKQNGTSNRRKASSKEGSKKV